MEALLNQLISEISNKQNISVDQALLVFKKCLVSVAKHLGLKYSDIFKIAMTELFLMSCLRSSCDKLTLDNCKKSCHCVEYYDERGVFRCVSRKIPNAQQINEDPDKYVVDNLQKTSELRELVHLASYLYHNYDGGGLTDNAFDALEYHLKKREKSVARQREKIGAPPVEKIRTQLPYSMPSLSKLKPDMRELLTFIKDDDIVWSLKLDGVSGMIVYDNGKLTGIYTRGDGTIGGNVTYLEKLVKGIPHTVKYKSTFVVRGEFILSKENWTKYNTSFSTPRHFVSSRINSGYVVPGVEDIDFVAYKLLKKGNETIESQQAGFDILKDIGFNVVEHGTLSKVTVFELINLYKTKREGAVYNIDGLVLAKEGEYKSITEKTPPISPTDTVAFKMTLEEQTRKTKVTGIEWNISKHGRYIPVALYEPVYIDGVRLKRATAHNARYVRDSHLGKGTEIVIVRSGDVIPYIKDVKIDERIDMIEPPKTYKWHWEGKDIVLDDIENNRDVQIQRILYFYEILGVPRIGEKTAEKFWESGMKTPESVSASTVQNFKKIKGFGEKTANSVYNNIHKTLEKVPIDRYYLASAKFSKGFGRETIKEAFRAVPNLFEMSESEIKKALKYVKGFGVKRIAQLSENIPKFREYVFSFAKDDVMKSISYHKARRQEMLSKGLNKNVQNKIFVFTGFMGNVDYDLEDYVYDNGGKFSKVVNSDVEAVVVGNLIDVTKKMREAQTLGIPILSLNEFLEKYKIILEKYNEKKSKN